VGDKRHDILLINPWVYDFAAYDLWAKPLGLLYLAALLERNSWAIHYIDCLGIHHSALRIAGKQPKRRSDHRGHFYREEAARPAVLKEIPRRFYRFGLSPGAFRKILASIAAPQAVLVTSGMTYWYPGVHEAIRIVKETFPDIPVILGGIYATLCPEHAREKAGADLVISGQGEVQVLEALERLIGVIPCFLPDPAPLDSLPAPAFGLYPELDYCCCLTARGCPYSCTYCASALLSPCYSRREPASVVEEIAHDIESYGVKDIAFYDDALLADQSFALALLRGIVERGIKVRFHCPNGLHCRGISAEAALLMRQAGFATIRLGFETSSRERQQRTGGKVNTEEFQQAVKNLHTAGYSSQEIGAYILVGLPNQGRAEVEETIRFVRECGARPLLAEYSPIPGTVLWEEAAACSPFDLLREPLFHNNTILPCRWAGLDWGDLQALKAMTRTP
jgi:radical SAM superfamily enzyme YgiQ (UPF0313 family)